MFRPFIFLAFSWTPFAHSACNPNTFDYVIVGGGPAGLVVANRLSTNPNISVAVIEAGDSTYNNPNVTAIPKSILDIGLFPNTSIEWSYKTVPQRYTLNRTLDYWAGKALGGSTAINGMTYLRAEKAQIDAWEELGNESWNWDSLLVYYIGQENLSIPSDEQRKKGATYEEEAHGFGGGLGVAFTPYLTGQGAFAIINETSHSLGYPFNVDANDGNMRGTTLWPMTINVNETRREDAPNAWYYHIADRPNLHVFLNTTATRIIWQEDRLSTSDVVASGVETMSSHGSVEIVHAAREVIVAAGSIRSPALLEHSGIGNEAILESLNIKSIVSHPSIGSDLQDQPAIGIAYASSTNWTGYPTFVTYMTASDLFLKDLPDVKNEIRANISAYAAEIVSDYAPGALSHEVQETLLKHQVDLVFETNSTVPLIELLWAPVGNSIIAQYWNLLPLSRGSIHIATSDPLVPPKINPNFLQLPIDTYVLAAAAIRVRELCSTAPLSEHVTAEVSPSFDVVPQNATWRDSAWKAWIDQSYSGNSHPVSTCAMMSKQLGGVVDNEGKVYGTQNVRVVDASVFPTQISGHLSATVYAVADKIAHAILSKLSKART